MGVGSLPINPEEPFYIFDLGAGTGRFGYLFLHELNKSLACHQFDGVKLRYIMTDMIEGNLHALRHHPYLQDMIDRGILDFAAYHTAFTEEPLALQASGHILSPEAIVNPIIIIGNYFFDVIPQDLFKVVDGRLHEGHVTVIAGGKVDVERPDPAQLKALRAEYHYVPVAATANYYSEATQEAVLRHYANAYKNIPFTLPVAAYQTLRYFKRLSHGRLLVLAGDQGVSTEKQLREAKEPVVSLQGGISMSVSYNAIAKYVVMEGGAAWLTTQPDPLFVTIAAAFGGNKAAHAETTLAFEDSFEAFQPSDYWKLTCCSEQEWKTPSIEYLLLLVKLGNWDPLNFHAFFSSIRKQLPTANEEIKAALAETIHRVWAQFYPVSEQEGDFVMNLGVLLFELQLPAEALLFFERSLTIKGSNPQAYQNMAACYQALNQPEKAFDSLSKARSSAPAN